ncbi:MAG TPA: ribose-phosphate diphosphokinase [Gemmatimonadaceae bacterium]|nr:ribose-phosphate diphosphokinase [Gemmatimonadaceae bacterium]
MNAIVLALRESEPLARRVGELAQIPLGVVESRRFPDRETYLRIDARCEQKSIVLVCTLDRPDDKLLPLVFLADAARELGASRVGLVAPYLAYMRQDRRFQRGEAITSRTFAGLLSRYVDWLVTIDPHLHRYSSLTQIYALPNRIVHAAPALAAWIATHVDRPVLVGPDEESEQWVKDVASRAGAPYVVLRKTRRGDRVVDVSVPDVDRHRTHTPVVVDDIVSSAQTMVETVKNLVAVGLRAPVCVGVHALFSENAEQALRDAGAAQIVTTTSVPHATNTIDIVPLLIPAIHELAS